MCATAANLVERVLPEVDLRQWVITFPFAWRLRLGQDGALLGTLTPLFVQTVQAFYTQRAAPRTISPHRQFPDMCLPRDRSGGGDFRSQRRHRSVTTSPCARHSMASRCTPLRGLGPCTSPGARRCCATCYVRPSRSSGSSALPVTWCASPSSARTPTARSRSRWTRCRCSAEAQQADLLPKRPGTYRAWAELLKRTFDIDVLDRPN
jgi:hypothetical protein